ncbi:hypothetical protein AVEN_158766-1 [Araneus ventricosus]|uniref:Uncharacterized protein n=1 Tax=Araneus ventricosus TaxID=182803 RepID=A0A4Y2MKI1_ARAVE|nr:hypothetical protein AVEN_158766-1 [Araneus ventricosus]
MSTKLTHLGEISGVYANIELQKTRFLRYIELVFLWFSVFIYLLYPAIQAGKSITSCPQIVFLPLTGSERMLSSSLNMDLSLPTPKAFTSLTAINAVVQNWHNISLCHGVRPHSVLTSEKAIAKFRTRMAEKSRQ